MMTPTGIVQPEDAKYIKRRIKSGTIDVHPTETALVVNYEVEAIILGESSNPVLSDKKDCQKIIRLKSLNKNSDCSALAREVINKCSLIHPSKVADIEHLIYFLQSRKENAFSAGSLTDSASSSGSSGLDTPQSNGSTEKACYAKLEEYVELLYEDLPGKVRGSALIMQLSRDTDNLEELARSDAVLSALARVLREDYKKSIELSTSIISVFHSFSLFSQFHPLILQYKIGSLCIGILEFELQRQMQWKAEALTTCIKERETRREGLATSVSRLPLPRRSSTPSPAPPEKKRLSLLPIPKTVISQRSTPVATDEESSQKKFTAMVARQEKLLRVNFLLLLNISENIKVEDKVRKRNIVAMLVQCLESSNVALLSVVAKFLLKLSIRVENKDEMGNLNVIEKLPKLLQMNNFDLEYATLTLLFNLSFDSKLRDKMIRVGFLQKLVSLLGDLRHTKIVLQLLYHLSLDDRVKAMFIYTDCLIKLMEMLVVTDDNSEEYKILVALCLNVALIPKCAEVMCTGTIAGSVVQQICHTCLAHHNVLLMKVIRNLSMHPSTSLYFLVFAEELLKIVVSCSESDFLLECIGTLANLPLNRLPIVQLLDKFGLLPWISSTLIPGKAPDDLVLETVMMIGSAAADEACAKLFCKADILISLIELLKSKQEDDEMVLQIIYVFYQISRHNDTRKYLITETEATAYLLDLMTDNNAQIRKVCDICMEMIKDDDSGYEERVKAEKFKSHNAHWLSIVGNKALETSLMGTSDTSESVPHLNLLNQSFLMQTGSHISIANTDDIEIISNHPNSNEGSRPVSRYDSEGEDYTDSVSLSTNSRSGRLGGRSSRGGGGGTADRNGEAVRNALRNLVIATDDSSLESHRYFHLNDAATADSNNAVAIAVGRKP